MMAYYIEHGCSICSYLLRAVYLANTSFVSKKFNLFFVDRDMDEFARINLKRVFNDVKGRVPVVQVDDTVFYVEGIPPWKEIYYLLSSLAKSDNASSEVMKWLR